MNLTVEFQKARRYFAEQGLASSLVAVRSYLRYHLMDKWRFVYLGFTFDRPIRPVEDPSLVVKPTGPADLAQIHQDLFPYLIAEQAYDRRYFEQFGHRGSVCFVAESEGRFVHYSWVFTDVFRSPLVEVPFESSKLRSNDSYIGPVFTVPRSRGMIYFYVLPVILEYLRESGSERVLVLVDGSNNAAVRFYRKLGFVPITDAQSKGVISLVCRRLNGVAG